MTKKGLTTRQWALYNYLKNNYEEGTYITKQAICRDLPNFYEIKNDETRVCRTIEEDVRVINDCDTIQKLIVSNRTGYKIGSRHECAKYIERRFQRDLKSLKLNWKLLRKVEENGQCRFTFGEGYERNFIETFIENI